MASSVRNSAKISRPCSRPGWRDCGVVGRTSNALRLIDMSKGLLLAARGTGLGAAAHQQAQLGDDVHQAVALADLHRDREVVRKLRREEQLRLPLQRRRAWAPPTPRSCLSDLAADTCVFINNAVTDMSHTHASYEDSLFAETAPSACMHVCNSLERR